MAVCVLCIFLVMPWKGLHYVIVAFSGQTHLLFDFVVGFSIESSSLDLS